MQLFQCVLCKRVLPERSAAALRRTKAFMRKTKILK
jgi:hypothetical protein